MIVINTNRLNGSHIWIGGGIVPKFEIKDPLNVKFEEDKLTNPRYNKTGKSGGGVTLNNAWFFDGFSWITAKKMKVKRNKAACSLVIDKDGEVKINA